MIFHEEEKVVGATFFYVKVQKEGTLVGYVDITLKDKRPKEARLSYIFVKEEFRQKGWAKKMLEYVRENIAPEIVVVTEPTESGKLLFANEAVKYRIIKD